jgi:alginate O-acetyltransferase complex protein AlgI
MLFHTWVFAVFFLIVFPVYLIVRKNNSVMNVWLMIASYAFYGWWNPLYLVLLFGSSAVDYLMVLFMEKSESPRTRKIWLVISLVSNFGLLGVFKYAGFLVDNVNALLIAVHAPYAIPNPDIVLPIGISFHTFQSMSYTIDAYHRKIQTERSFVRFLTFVSFFPQLVAGPIERASNLLPQLQGTPVVTKRDMVDGLSLFVVGFFKKVAMADFLSIYVDRIYAHPESFQSSHLLMATFAFAWQIYFDFSGYTDMARGIACFMGFRLMLNFNNPYVATGLGDFWNRWHISLSTWFKDYVYFPLGGNRGGKWFTYRNMVATMLISGLWHGAAWGYIIWGALHAVGRVVTRELEQSSIYRDRVPKIVKQLGVFVFVSFTWIFFRGQTWGKSWLVLSRIFTTGWVNPEFPGLALLLIFAIWIYQFLYTSEGLGRRIVEWTPLRVALVGAMLAYLGLVAQPGSQQFIYFQF